jgi:hypothetical protein
LNQKHPSEDDDTEKTKELQALLFSNRAATLTRMALQKEEKRTSSSSSSSTSPNSFDFDPSSSSASSIQEPTTLELLASALADSERCLSLRPSWSKGWVRRGTACLAMKRPIEAEDSFRKVSGRDTNTHPLLLPLHILPSFSFSPSSPFSPPRSFLLLFATSSTT